VFAGDTPRDSESEPMARGVGFEQALARDRLGIEANVLPGGYLIALARPAELTRYLLAAVTM
jgi:hypothetical protein